MEKAYYKEFDILKGLGILCVLLGHSFALKGIDLTEYSYWSKYIRDLIYTFHMPLFFFAAGFLANKEIEYDLKKFYISKVKRLLIPYFFISFINFFIKRIFSNLVSKSGLSIKEILLYGGGSWFLYTLFLIFLIFPALDKYILKKNLGKFIVFLFVLNIFKNIFFSDFSLRIFTIDNILFYLIYFSIGYFFKNQYLNLKNKILNMWLIVINILIFLSYPYFNSSKTIHDMTIGDIFIPISGILLFLALSEKIKEICKADFLTFCGRNSLIFYLLEGYAIVVIREVLIRVIPINQIFLLVFMFFILKLIVICVGIKIINKIKILNFLFGNTTKKM